MVPMCNKLLYIYSVMWVKNQHLGCDMQQEKIDIIAICNILPKPSVKRYVTEDSETNIRVETKMKQLKAESILIPTPTSLLKST